MMKMPSLFLLAGTALLAAAVAQPPAHSSIVTHATNLAQATPRGDNQENKKNKAKENNKHGHKRGRDAAKNKPPHKPFAKKHAKPGQAAREAEQKHAKPALKNENIKHGQKRGHDAAKNKPPHKPSARKQAKPGQAAREAEQKHAKPAVKNEKPQATPASASPKKPDHTKPHQAKERRGNKTHQRSEKKKKEQAPPAAAQRAAPPAPPKAATTKPPASGTTESTHTKAEQAKPEPGKASPTQSSQTEENAKPAPQKKTQQVEHNKGAQSPAKPTTKPAEQPTHNAPKAAQQPAVDKTPTTTAAPPPPTKPRSADAFIRRKGAKPAQDLNTVRRSRHETRQDNRLIIREGDRTIERENNRAFIRHNESNRFAVGARRVEVEHHGDRTVTIVVRPDGVRIVSTTDRHGHLIRRVRRDRHGREIVIIDDSRFAPRRRDEVFVDVPPPHIRDRDRYIVDAGRADRRRIYKIFTAPPIVRLHRHYTVDQVRYSYPLREYMPRVDLDIHFDTGSWQLTPAQIDRLSEIAAALNEAIDRNPREVYLIEGHTDAVGSWEDNLSLSDRRAEAVAVALTEQFHVPPENLVTQGYGEAHLKVETQGPSRINRRVAVRRITPLIANDERRGRR